MRWYSKNYILIFLLIIFIGSTCVFAADKNAVAGKWLDEDKVNGNSIIQIFEKDSKFFGKIISMKNNEQLDINNPDESKRKEPLLNCEILKNFSFSGGEWKNGTIYDPKNGKTYSCKMWLENDNILNIRGFIGVSLFGVTKTWKKVISSK